MAQFYPSRWGIQEGTLYLARLLGAAAANPVKQEGEGFIVTWQSTGLYRVQFAENPYQFVTGVWGFQATAPANAAGWTVVFGDYDAVNYRLPFSVYNATVTATLADLPATIRLGLAMYFQRSGY